MRKNLKRKAALLVFLVLYPFCLYPGQPDKTYTVYLVSRGYHTGIVVPVTELSVRTISVLGRVSGGCAEFGWGEEYYYQTPDATTLDAVRALFLPNRSVVRVEYFPGGPEPSLARSGSAVKFVLSEKDFSNLCRYIDDSFAREDGALVSESEEKCGQVVYFMSNGTYHLFNNCNRWAAEALSSAGLDIALFGLIHSSQLMSRCRGKGAVVKEPQDSCSGDIRR